MRIKPIAGQQCGIGVGRRLAVGLSACATLALAACDSPGGTGGAPRQDIPAAFDTAARVISAEGHPLASCVAIADDKEKLGCYAALGFKDKGDVDEVEELAGAAEVRDGKRWQITAPRPGGSDSFQGSAVLTFAELANEGPIAFRGTRVILRCPAEWGGSSNQQWAASIDLPGGVAYESRSTERGAMVIDVDGGMFTAMQFSRSSFNLPADQAESFRDAMSGGKALSVTLKTIDGKTGTMKAALPDPGDGLKGYFAKFCS